MLYKLVNFLLLKDYPVIFFNMDQISTNYKNIILKFVVLFVTLLRPRNHFNRRRGNNSFKKKGMKRYNLIIKSRMCKKSVRLIT